MLSRVPYSLPHCIETQTSRHTMSKRSYSQSQNMKQIFSDLLLKNSLNIDDVCDVIESLTVFRDTFRNKKKGKRTLTREKRTLAEEQTVAEEEEKESVFTNWECVSDQPQSSTSKNDDSDDSTPKSYPDTPKSDTVSVSTSTSGDSDFQCNDASFAELFKDVLDPAAKNRYLTPQEKTDALELLDLMLKHGDHAHVTLILNLLRSVHTDFETIESKRSRI